MTEYLKIVFQNLEPVRIADDSTSQSGQTVTLRYIPGTALRGIVINALAVEEDFEEIKRRLFSPMFSKTHLHVGISVSPCQNLRNSREAEVTAPK